MKKSVIIGIVIVLIIILGFYFYFSGKSTPLDCAGQGERTGDWEIPMIQYKECCEGLKDVSTSDSVSVADECYWAGTESGVPFGICSNCGNGICEDVENVCGCSEDCVGKGKSDYDTVQQFCDKGYEQYCDMYSEGMELDLCNLCA